MALTFSSLLVLFCVPLPKRHLALSLGKLVSGLVEGKVPLGEQGLHLGNLALISLGGSVPLLRFQDKVANPLLKRGDLFPSFPSLGIKPRAILPEVGTYLALPRAFPLGRFPSSPLILPDRPCVPLPLEEAGFL